MKLTLLEAGVLDYTGPNRTFAVPNAIPAGAMGVGVEPPPAPQKDETLSTHLIRCKVCRLGTKCKIARKLSANSV